MEQVPTDKKQRMPSSRVLEEVIDQAPADYFTVGWLTSILQQRSFGIVMLFLGLLATIPVGSTVPGLMLAAMAVQLIAGRELDTESQKPCASMVLEDLCVSHSHEGCQLSDGDLRPSF